MTAAGAGRACPRGGGGAATGRGWDAAEAYAWCDRFARTTYENFTKVSWFLSPVRRRHILAVYAFCRRTDDIGDAAAGDRLALLDEWEAALDRALSGERGDAGLTALAETTRACAIDPRWYRKLIEANRMDQRQQRWPAYADLLRYCDHSANPVGRMVLAVFGYRDEERGARSDAVCTGLQLANFWQDVRRDRELGRVYLPLEDRERFGCREADLDAGSAGERLRALLAFEVGRAEECFRRGRELLPVLDSESRFEVELFIKGGEHVLRAIRKQRFDVLSRRPEVSRAAKLRMVAGTAVRLGSARSGLWPGRRHR